MTLDLIEVAAMKLCDSHLHRGWALASDEERTLYRELAGSVIVFVTPLIEAATLERAAQMVEGLGGVDDEEWAVIARDIRALIIPPKEQP